MMRLTENDKKILRIIQKYPSPSQSEQTRLVVMSKSSFWRHVKEMEDAGITGKIFPPYQQRKLVLNCDLTD
jgi:DNA-binding Lrp family transcriptional regulator